MPHVKRKYYYGIPRLLSRPGQPLNFDAFTSHACAWLCTTHNPPNTRHWHFIEKENMHSFQTNLGFPLYVPELENIHQYHILPVGKARAPVIDNKQNNSCAKSPPGNPNTNLIQALVSSPARDKRTEAACYGSHSPKHPVNTHKG